MGLLTRLFAPAEGRSLENPSTPLSAPDDWLGDALGSFKSSSGVRVNRETALTYSAIWKGATLISGDVGKLPVHVDEVSDGRRRAIRHPAYNLLRYKPNDAMGAMTFRSTLQGHALLDGNGYAFIARNGGGEPEELLILAPRQVTPVRANGVLWYVYQFLDGSTRKIIYTDILHIKGFSYDGLLGYNLIHKARESIGWAMGMQTYGATFFRNNATPRLVLEHPNKLKQDSAKNLRDSWERLYSGLENSHRTAVLEEGMKAQVLSINASDAQLIEQMKFTFVDVANWLKLPPHKVGGDGRTAYASLEQENQAYLDDCLDHWLVTWEEECREKLLTEEEKRNGSHDVRFSRKELLRADIAARGLYYVQAIGNGWMSPDEVREEEGRNPIEGGEGRKHTRPLNMQAFGGDDDEEEMTPAEGQEQAIKDGEELLGVPDVRQLDSHDCGAAAAMAVGQYFDVGPASLDEWKAALGTDGTGTKPMAIVQYLAELGLAVTTAQNMTTEDLGACWRKGMPVICPIQQAGGHYVVVVGAALGQVFVQDPGAAAGMPPGRMIDAETWLASWHDTDVDGKTYTQFGIAVAKDMPIEPPAPPVEPGAIGADGKPVPAPLVKTKDFPPAKRSETRCGVGSGVPGPCAGEGGAGDEQTPEEKIADAREEEDQGIADTREQEDSDAQDKRDEEDEKIFDAREAEDNATQEQRDAEDAADTAATNAETVRDDAREKEGGQQESVREKEDGERGERQAAEQKEMEDGHVKELEEQEARQKEEVEALESAQEKETVEKGESEELTEKQDEEQQSLADKHTEEEDARAEKETAEAAAMEAKHEKEEANVEKARAKEDKETEKTRKEEDKAAPKPMTAVQLDKLYKDREKEDSQVNAARQKEDKAIDKSRDKENKDDAAKREKEDKALAKDREQEDKTGKRAAPRSANKQSANAEGREAIATVAKAALADVVRRMTKRVALQGERAAGDAKKFGVWLDGIDADHRATIHEAAHAAETALAALGPPADVTAWLLERLRVEYLELSGRCTPAQLSGEAAKLTARLVEVLPAEAGAHFLRCGGVGSGVPGPCADEKTPESKGGLLSKIWAVLKADPIAALKNSLDPADKGKESAELGVKDLKAKSYNGHIANAKGVLEKMGVKDLFKTDLQKSADMRASAIKDPDKFDKRVASVEDSLRSAAKFAGDNKAATGSIRDKMSELDKLKADVDKFRKDQQPEVLPDHFGRKGAANENTKAAIDHLSKEGSDAGSAVKHVMKHGGVSESTAKRYVRAAVKAAKAYADGNVLKLKNAG